MSVSQRAKKILLLSIEKILNINTRKSYVYQEESLTSKATFEDIVPYASVHYYHLRRVFKCLTISSSDHFIDIGCGMGRVVCFAALYPFKRCSGIDLDQELCETARHNAARLRFKKSPIEIMTGDVLKANFSSITVFYLYNPFGEETMHAFLEKLSQSYRLHPRNIQLVYYNAKHEHLFEAQNWLEKYNAFSSMVGHPISFWRNAQQEKK